jgi:hypothetical protein
MFSSYRLLHFLSHGKCPSHVVTEGKDFLPPPEQLALKEENVKITISLKKSSIEFFKKEAKKNQTSYQKMIKQLIDWYTSHYKKSA